MILFTLWQRTDGHSGINLFLAYIVAIFPKTFKTMKSNGKKMPALLIPNRLPQLTIHSELILSYWKRMTCKSIIILIGVKINSCHPIRNCIILIRFAVKLTEA